MPGGRPTVMTEHTLQILEEAFSVGATDKEACFLANISESTLYNYCDAHPEYLQRKEALKNMPNYKAKKLVVRKIEEGDEKQANWWLERKAKDDGFSTRSEITGKDGGAVQMEDSRLDSLIGKLEDLNKDQYEAHSTGQRVSSE